MDIFVIHFFQYLVMFTGALTVSSRNPVHSILFLVLTFLNASALLIAVGAEFLALVLVVVYVGAIAVLFLFVVMMLDIKVIELKRNYLIYFPVGVLVLFVFATYFYIYNSVTFPYLGGVDFIKLMSGTGLSNLQLLAGLLYTAYFPNFILAGFILLVAMVGAILLTLSHRVGVKRQVISQQVFRGNSIKFYANLIIFLFLTKLGFLKKYVLTIKFNIFQKKKHEYLFFSIPSYTYYGGYC